MNLHHDRNVFPDTLKAASQHLKINLDFVEKDYWITLVLSLLAKSKYVADAVFKGGTSLAKGYNLIERFSEDVDIAVINDKGMTGNVVKTIIRNIEKEITPDLIELQVDGVTSKGSRFRKSVYEYVSIEKNNQNNKLIVEINSFANPFPFTQLSIKSLVFDFLTQTENTKIIDQFNLRQFEIKVLSKEQTLLEKLVSLIRFSFDANPIETISGKIRHFYDLYFLANDPECAEFIVSESFKVRFDSILQHDRIMFEEPMGWRTKSVSESPLVSGFETIWRQLERKYQSELSTLAYRTIPDSNIIAANFIRVIKLIE
ncbi:MAG: nucleotidyl transferase AbiEii/AbiGii toxin family protein [Saprospiraceae bacterium]